MVTHLTTIVFLYHHPEYGRITGRNILWPLNLINQLMHFYIRAINY